MNIYRVSCYTCSYCLQSLTIIAKDKEHAILLAEKWQADNGEEFIYSKSKWGVELLASTKDKGVINFHYGNGN